MKLDKMFSWLSDYINCPICNIANTASSICLHLNDYHRIPREDIATMVDPEVKK